MSANTQMERCPRCDSAVKHWYGAACLGLPTEKMNADPWHSTPAAPETPRSLPILDNQNAVKDRLVKLTAWDKTGTPRKEEA